MAEHGYTWRLRAGQAALIVAGAMAAASGCGTARRGEPVAEGLRSPSVQVRSGELVFMRHCYMCHPGGEGGLGPALNNKPLPGWAIREQVRHGFGAMPKFTEEEISGQQLEELAQYLKALKQKKG